MEKEKIRYELKAFLDKKVLEFNNPAFIKNDPICIPHLFSQKQDIEIAGFFAAVFAWGIRKTIINKCKFLLQLMDHVTYDLIDLMGLSIGIEEGSYLIADLDNAGE